MAFDWRNIEESVAITIQAMMLPGPPGTLELEPRIMGVLRSLERDDSFPAEGKRRVAELVAVLTPLHGASGLTQIGPERRQLVVERLVGFLRYAAHDGQWP